MKQILIPALRLLLMMTLLTGVIYPAAVTWAAHLLCPETAQGSLVYRDNRVVGSALLAQKFESPGYFRSRPSAAEWSTLPSGASNLGPASGKLQEQIKERADVWRDLLALPAKTPVPSDLLAASASGLDPHITLEAARFQVARVAQARRLPFAAVEDILQKHLENARPGSPGVPYVNVLLVNMELDRIHSAP
ncbi:MAG TPA: potassium-transporting ATPase subunit KdpC [Pontiellaceae bacterium]|nr:potassium-transporting ATPase subunit KdpC [Pontiellaceae bacterium]HPR83346.1 potassium-transporting ATPase subunit KdpC [Pontiellaceae bacterium]